MQDFLNWLHNLPNVWLWDIIRSLILVLALVLLYHMINRIVSNQSKLHIEAQRRWMVGVRNLLLVLGLSLLATIWAQQITAVAVSMVAIAAAVAISGKEVIMCLLGSLYRSIMRSYSIGDFIEVNKLRGRVVDINFFGTTLLEIGPGHHSHFLTGQELSFPNSILLTQPVIKEEFSARFTVHVIHVPIALTHNILEAEAVLLAAAQEVCAPYLADAEKFMQNFQKINMVDSPSVKARTSIHLVDDEQALITVRIGIPSGQRHRIEQQVLHLFVARFFKYQAITGTSAAPLQDHPFVVHDVSKP